MILFTLGAVSAASGALAQSSGAKPDLTAGRQHFEQSCGVCHTKVLITSGLLRSGACRRNLSAARRM